MTLLLILLPALPMALALVAPSGRLGPQATAAGVASTALIALLLALLNPEPIRLDWLMLGTTLGLDVVSRPLLAAAALVWFVATLAAKDLFTGDTGPRFTMCYLLTLAGNMGVLITQDMVSFYLSFAVMTFAGYGLIAHQSTDEALRAGRIYLILAIAGEALLLAGLFVLGAAAGNPTASDMPAVYADLASPGMVGGLLLAGFAVKMGLMPLHVWLPLAHPAAPVPASAVLSAVIVKGGLLGWLRLVPPGEAALLPAADLLIALGLLTAFAAALIGCLQHRPKTVLAYSTVSQMGLLAIPVGMVVGGRAESDLLLPVIGLFALHHALAKGALFLALDHIKTVRPLFLAATVLAAAALVGVPFTSGLVAKAGLKAGLTDPYPLLITLTSVTTALLLSRFLVLAWPRRRDQTPAGARNRVEVAWLVLVALGLALPWILAGDGARAYALQFGGIRDGVWPALVAAALALAAGSAIKRWPGVPEGDLVVPAERLLRAGYQPIDRLFNALKRSLVRMRERVPTLATLKRDLPMHEPSTPVVALLMLVLVLLLPALYLLDA
ncbi:formate hydrogenlyase subunit 3/multisubunit Na+/H+ antiporter MnhD subunit [Natronocella acetinitrilica]|uniref:Formate hydrogenlyase subunit 3/multisubunit Na+/H+ antiporter MnhD subunit n=1 Tax=Natronocella acetinitrilica TaxID=414046 RepID=A0AAE3G6T2_9GAMM|nr:complex I subunit 5 family protein [Natronocella acetinitrilica]MCP1674907.1 formate hydrogenlyase subunit 3/multisubunit Na+/H+ antiporter MnhD subunit [Natronocella acetinitrilica]